MGPRYLLPSEDWQLRPAEVHLCFVPLAASDASVAAFDRDLDPEEAGRARRFATAELRRSFVIGRGVLRSILGRSLGIEPGLVRFAYGEQGKPRIAGDPLRFNLSHSGGAALYAFSLDREVGVDIEALKPIDDCESIARRFFSQAEVRDLLSLQATERQGAFLTCWTRKEAYIKARGEGLSLPLDRFRVSLRPAEPPRLDAPDDPRGWSIHEASPAPGYAAALVASGAGCRVRAWRFDDAQHCAAHFSPAVACA